MIWKAPNFPFNKLFVLLLPSLPPSLASARGTQVSDIKPLFGNRQFRRDMSGLPLLVITYNTLSVNILGFEIDPAPSVL